LVATDGRALGTATIDEFGVHIRVTLGDGVALAGSSLDISTFPASAECPADEYSLEFGELGTGGTTEDLPRDMMPRTDPTFWRSILLVADGKPPLENQCARTVLASAPIRWAIAPAGLSAPIIDSGPALYARGSVVVGATGPTAYMAAAGDTAIAVAARLGITVEDLSWLNPTEFDLRAGMPINLDPGTRGMPLD
jgi:hypothetical protein